MRSSQGMKWKLKQKHSHHVGEDERKVSNIFICLEVFGKNVHVCWKLRHQSFCVAGINARILVTNSSFNHNLVIYLLPIFTSLMNQESFERFQEKVFIWNIVSLQAGNANALVWEVSSRKFAPRRRRVKQEDDFTSNGLNFCFIFSLNNFFYFQKYFTLLFSLSSVFSSF